jgi:hypothetical protein
MLRTQLQRALTRLTQAPTPQQKSLRILGLTVGRMQGRHRQRGWMHRSQMQTQLKRNGM